MVPQRGNLGNIIALAGGILATLAFFLFPYISLGFFGSYTAVQLAGGILGSSSPELWLELLIALAVIALAGFSWSNGSGLPALSALLVGLSVVTLVVIVGFYVVQSQQKTMFGAPTAFYSTGFWLYLFGIVVALAGGIVQLRISNHNNQ